MKKIGLRLNLLQLKHFGILIQNFRLKICLYQTRYIITGFKEKIFKILYQKDLQKQIRYATWYYLTLKRDIIIKNNSYLSEIIYIILRSYV